jgi:osmoprotectant transport system permease protein
VTAGLRPARAPFLVGLGFAAASHPAVAGLAVGLVADGAGPRPLAPDRLLALAANHLALTGAGLLLVAGLGIALGIAATRPALAPIRGGIDALAALAQAVPPVVVVALALPVLGFGGPPTLLALLAYGLMPCIRGTVGALEAVPRETRAAAEAIGLTPGQILARVELPLAAPGLIETVRTALVLSVSVAAVGALAGASTLGTPIVAGLQNQNFSAMLQGTLATAALAFLGDAALLAAGGWMRRD